MKKLILTLLAWAILSQVALGAYGISKWGTWGSPPVETGIAFIDGSSATWLAGGNVEFIE